MSPAKGPTLRAQWLGKQLREYREQARLTLSQAGEYLQRDKGTVSRIEAGIIPCRAADAMALLNLYGVDDPRVRDGIDRLARDVWCKGWWDDYAADAGNRIIDRAWLEARSEGLRAFHATVFPGLLQTEDYARSVMRAVSPEASWEEVDLWVEFRMNRQHALERVEPLFLDVILDEAVIERGPVDGEVMRRQLLHVGKMMERPYVAVRILPFSAGLHASPYGPFTIFDMAAPYPYVVQIDAHLGAVYHEGEGVDRFDRTYDHLKTAALSPDESRSMIDAAIEDLV